MHNFFLFTYNTFIKILYMFRASPCSFSRGLRRNCIYAASGIVTLCRWLSCAPVKKELPIGEHPQTPAALSPPPNTAEPVDKTVTCRGWRYQRLHIYNYDVDLKMSRVMLETCRGFLINVLYVNKQEFCTSSWRSTKVILRCTVNQSSKS